jgi:hypothetical protein
MFVIGLCGIFFGDNDPLLIFAEPEEFSGDL